MMNLFYTPKLSELSALIGQCNDAGGHFHLVVDYDGEVLLESNSKRIKQLLPRFKFYVKDLHGKLNIGNMAARNIYYFNSLFKKLIFCWEKDIKGDVSFDKVTTNQTFSEWAGISQNKNPNGFNSSRAYNI